MSVAIWSTGCPVPRRADARQSSMIFRQRFCKTSKCRSLFVVCSHCDRGHQYCSRVCRRISRLDQQRVARRRYQLSPEGRLDHRDRQRAYRLRKAAIARALLTQSVTEHGSQTGAGSVTMPSPCSWLPEPVRPQWWNLLWRLGYGRGLVICCFCGRMSRFVDPFCEPT